MDLAQIQKSGFSQEQAQQVEAALPSLGDNQKGWLDDLLGRSDFNYLKNDIATVITESAKALAALRSNDSAIIIRLLTQSVDNIVYDFGKFALPLVLDIKQLSKRGQLSLAPEVMSAMDVVMIKCISDLPDAELNEVIGHHLINFVKVVDFVHELKRRYAIDDGDSIEDWGKEYLQALENNEELIGSQSITVDGQALPPFIKNWIKDYIATVSSGPIGRGSLAEAQYFSKSPNVLRLTIEDKRIVQELLQLYDWLLVPSGTFAELEAYEAASSGESSQPLAQQRAPINEFRRPQPAPSVRPRPQAPAIPANLPIEPTSVQDILMDRNRSANQTFLAGRTNNIPTAQDKKDLDVEAKLAALRKKVQSSRN